MGRGLAKRDVDLGLFANDPGDGRHARPVGIDRVVLAGRGTKTTVRTTVRLDGERKKKTNVNKIGERERDKKKCERK